MELTIDSNLAQHLISTQFPQWGDLTIKPVAASGWDNRTFHLGNSMLIRLPSTSDHALAVEKEQYWLPKLAPYLPLPIPAPIAIGKPDSEYPWHWSINHWLPGEPATNANITDTNDFAMELAQFLSALQSINTTGGPIAGAHSFYRGGSLSVYDSETKEALTILKDKIDFITATELWNQALSTSWQNPSVWVHGDVSLGNLLVLNGNLSAVIDFGQLAVGDPACDLAIAWTFFDDEARKIFRSQLKLDNDTWIRGLAWTLWKAVIIASGLVETNAAEGAKSWKIIDTVIKEYNFPSSDPVV